MEFIIISTYHFWRISNTPYTRTCARLRTICIANINPSILQFEWSDYNAVFGNVDIAQYSQTFMQVDYNNGTIIPTNFELLYSGSATRASIQDSNYTQRGWSNGRYNGSSNSSIDFNQ